MKKAIRTCQNCSSEFSPSTKAQKYCRKQTTIECEACGKGFETICAKSLRKTCNKSCSSKLIRREQGIKNTKPCEKCGKIFQPKNQFAKYCNRVVELPCRGCPNMFQRKCNGDRNSYCSSKCRNKHMRSTSYSIKKKRTCIICEKIFTPANSRQKICNSIHRLNCMLCEKSFTPKKSQTFTDENLGKYCSNSCSTLAQLKTAIEAEKISQFKNPNQWAKDFKGQRGRKPTIGDFQAYFNVTNLPNSLDRKLLRKARSSRWEALVRQYIETTFPSLRILENKRILKFEDSNFPKEIDIYTPELQLGFEVQDFATHSKMSDFEKVKCHWSNKLTHKHGPSYHGEKIRIAKNMGIQLVEIWEDSIMSGEFKDIIDNVISVAGDTNEAN